jgi:hypothetical protein
MVTTKQQELIDWAIEKLESYDREKKLYNFSAIILSILDVFCGVVALFYAGMMVTSVIASILCGTAWGARAIQLVKCEKLAKALKALTVPSLAYISVRKERSEYMKNTKARNVVIGALTLLGFASVIVCHFVPALVQYIDYAIYYLCALLPADLYAVFNNAHLSAAEMQAKVDKKLKADAELKAKAELDAKQKAELEALTNKKLEELKNKPEA